MHIALKYKTCDDMVSYNIYITVIVSFSFRYTYYLGIICFLFFAVSIFYLVLGSNYIKVFSLKSRTQALLQGVL